MAIKDNSKEPKNPGTKPESSATKGAVSNSITLDPKNPIPIEFNSNIFVSLKGKRYIPFLNPSDNFAQLLTEANLLSSTNSACTSSKAEYCLGRGLFFKDNKEDKQFNDWSVCVNRKQQSLNQILKNAFSNKNVSGNTYIQVIRGKVAGKKFVRVYLRNYMDCRLSSPEEGDDEDICNTVYISKYFRKLGIWGLNLNKTEEIPIYSPNMFDNAWAEDDKGNQHTIFHLKHDTDGYDYYGMPSNLACLANQILEYKHSRYNLDNFDNNLVIGGVVVVKGAMTPEEAKKVGRDIIYQHSGDGKRGRWVILSSETGLEQGVDIKEFTKQQDSSFVEGDDHNMEKIFMNNKWNKLLIGGSEKKGIGQGNSAYIRSVFDIANNTVIMPEQQFMLDKFLNPLMRICDDWMGTSWSSMGLGLKALQPVSFLGDINVNSILKVDEGRAIIDKEAIGGEKGEAFIDPGKPLNDKPQTPNKNVPD